MLFKCPFCNKHGEIEDANVPQNGIYALCPQCSNRFLIKQTAPNDFVFEYPDMFTTKAKVSTNMNYAVEKGKEWALKTFYFFCFVIGLRILFAFGASNASERIISLMSAFIVYVIVICPIAFIAGYISAKSK